MADDLIIDEIVNIDAQTLMNTVATLQVQHGALVMSALRSSKREPLKRRQEWTGKETYPGMGSRKYIDASTTGGFGVIWPSGRRKVSFS